MGSHSGICKVGVSTWASLQELLGDSDKVLLLVSMGVRQWDPVA